MFDQKKWKEIAQRYWRFGYYNRIKIFDYDAERRIRRSFWEKTKMVLNPESAIVLPFTDIDITTFCNLRCRRCAKCLPYFKHKKHFSADEIKENLDLLTKYVDRIYVANILGGEPLLNPDLPRIIEICAGSGKINYLELTTNATIIPDDEVLRAIKEGGVTVHLSNYLCLEDRYQKNKEELIRKLEQFDIPHEFQFHDKWLDLGEIEKRSYSEERLARIFKDCPMNSCSVFNGKKLYRCGRASFLSQHGMEADGDDVIDLEKIHSRREMKKAIRKFFSVKYLPACQYCSEYPGEIPAGEQLGAEEKQ